MTGSRRVEVVVSNDGPKDFNRTEVPPFEMRVVRQPLERT
jgi:hypothetical protein